MIDLSQLELGLTKTKDVDTFEDKRLAKRIPSCGVTNMLFDLSTVHKDKRHIWGLD
jgi:hypothetical protein